MQEQMLQILWKKGSLTRGPYAQVRTCRSSNLQTVQIGESLMWSVRKGSVWTVEGSVVDSCGWKGRIVAVYEDVKSDTGDAQTLQP